MRAFLVAHFSCQSGLDQQTRAVAGVGGWAMLVVILGEALKESLSRDRGGWWILGCRDRVGELITTAAQMIVCGGPQGGSDASTSSALTSLRVPWQGAFLAHCRR